MDLSPQSLREVTFREKLRGYATDDVDDFVEQVAAGLEILLERLHQTMDRAVRAERRAAEVGEGDEAMRRTLVLAQRTADLAIQEAREQAGRIVEEAQAEAQAIRAEAADDARAVIEDATREAWARVRRLDAARDQLQADVGGLERYLADERGRLLAVFETAMRRVGGLVPEPAPRPPLRDVDLSALPSPPYGAPAPGSAGGPIDVDGSTAGALLGAVEHAPVDVVPAPVAGDRAGSP